ncbi:MAG: SpoIID/LytB domain-containing protein [Candidatus Gastranaerophilales bacterium]|nr:SpoIID/LytB domain-containing protein [Candidatus Gastranaerophilales bacterium]
MKINIIILTLILVLTTGYMKAFAYPSNAMVKVGIMDSKYTTVERNSVSIYGTGSCIVTGNNTKEEFIKLDTGKILNIKREDGHYILTYKSGDKENDYETTCYLTEDFTVTCPGGVLGIQDLIRGGKPALYRGEFRFYANAANPDVFYLVNCLDVEYYLKGVVPCEMPVYFGLEALKAQAVAARNYSLSPRTRMARCYDVVDSVASQVYHGYNREADISNRAIDETHGLVALYNDEMIVAVFSSTAGGYTECYSKTFSDPVTTKFPSPDKPYLKAIPDLPEIKPLNNEEDAYEFYSTTPVSYDIHSPLYRWTRVWSKEELENVLKANLVVQSKTGFVEPPLEKSEDFGCLKSIKVTERGESGKIIFMEIETDKNVYKIGKELVIRRLFTKDGKALPGANVVFKYETDDDGNWSDITAYGGGFGHGSGMSQYGAMYMARDCKMSFEMILKHYYSGICIGTKPFELKAQYITQCFYSPKDRAILVIPDRKNMEVLQLNINDNIVNLNLNNAGSKQRCEIDLSSYINQGELNTIIFTPPCQNRLDTRNLKKIEPVTIYIKLL